MKRCDFASIAKAIWDGIVEEGFSSREIFFEKLFFYCLCAEENSSFSYEGSQLSRWLNGLLKLSPDLIGYFLDDAVTGARKKLSLSILQFIIPMLSDRYMTYQDVYELLIQDTTVSQQNKKELTHNYPVKDDRNGADFLSALLVFGITRPFRAHDVRKAELIPAGIQSPSLYGYVIDEGVPAPCHNFCGRDDELQMLHEMLMKHPKVFLSGIPGIGKSEVAKAYAREHKKDYTNILWLTYSGNLKQDITEHIGFADDLPSEDREDRFRKHNRYLRSLKEDTLLVIDNFNATVSQDPFLPVILKYHCRIIFTTRSNLPEETTLLIKEINDPEVLFEFAAKYFSAAFTCRNIVEEIIETVHSHTLAVELAARLLETGLHSPKVILDKLKNENVALSSHDKISLKKDGRSRKATYYEHLHTLFSLFTLSGKEQDIMRALSLAPLTGISAVLLAQWLNLQDLNDVHKLNELGFVSRTPGNYVFLHPIIQEISAADLDPAISSCKTLLEGIRYDCLKHGLNLPYHKAMFLTIENIIRLAKKDDPLYYIRFLEDAFPYMGNYGYRNGMRMIITQLEPLIENDSIACEEDQALLLLFKAELEDSPEQRAHLLETAIELIPLIHKDNAALVSNLQYNLGLVCLELSQNDQAIRHMDSALELLQEYDLLISHDSLMQVIGQATALNNNGYPTEALKRLKGLNILLKKENNVSSDHALVLSHLSRVYLNTGNISLSRESAENAARIYGTVYADEPEILMEKNQEINAVFQKLGMPEIIPNNAIT